MNAIGVLVAAHSCDMNRIGCSFFPRINSNNQIKFWSAAFIVKAIKCKRRGKNCCNCDRERASKLTRMNHFVHGIALMLASVEMILWMNFN